jgi:hypothetical protein
VRCVRPVSTADAPPRPTQDTRGCQGKEGVRDEGKGRGEVTSGKGSCAAAGPQYAVAIPG